MPLEAGHYLTIKEQDDLATKFKAGTAFFGINALILLGAGAGLRFSGKESTIDFHNLLSAGGYLVIPAVLCLLATVYFDYKAKLAAGDKYQDYQQQKNQGQVDLEHTAETNSL